MPKKGDAAGGQRLPLREKHAPDPEVVAGEALAFLAADAERLRRFLAVTGLDSTTLRRAAAGPGFALAVLSHICEDERLLVAFAAEAGLPPESIGRLVQADAERRAWTDP